MASEIKKEYGKILSDLANTMLSVARESVTLIKRSDQEVATKLTREKEWEVYLEFLKIMFNLADRASAFYVPIQQQPLFMDSLEDQSRSMLLNAQYQPWQQAQYKPSNNDPPRTFPHGGAKISARFMRNSDAKAEEPQEVK